MHRTLSLVSVLSLAAFAPAQLRPGHSFVEVIVTNVGGEIYDVDHTTRTATKLTISSTLVTERPNCVLMLSPANGYLATNPVSGTGNVYSFVLVGTTVTETLLNTSPTRGANIGQLAIFSGKIYFCVPNGTTLGWIQSVPVGGGPVTDEIDLSTLGAMAAVNALCDLGGKLYCATFDSGPGNTAVTPGELFEYDPGTRTGRLVMKLPVGKFDPVNNPWNTGIVNMRPYPPQPNLLALLGVYGDLLIINPATATVVRHDWTGTKNPGGNALASGSVNAFDWDPIAQDWVVSTREGSIEHWVHDQQAEKKIIGIGSSTTPTSNSTTGIQYFPFDRGGDASYGPGCQGNGTWEPTDSSIGQPIAGNSAFMLGLFAAEGNDVLLALIGLQNANIRGVPLPFDLTGIGATPSCFLRTDILLALPTVAAGAGAGQGSATIALPIPAGTQGGRIFRQWAVLQATPTNPAGVVVSNARMTDIR